LPAPSTVVATGWQLTRTGELPMHLAISLRRVAIGLSIGAWKQELLDELLSAEPSQ
jgi:sulfonate transport system permease protein